MVAGRPLLPGRLAGLHSGAALRSMHCAALGLLGCCTSARNGSLVLRRGGFHCLRAWVRASGVACVGPPAGPCAFLESFCPSSPPPLVPSSPPLPSHPPPACLLLTSTTAQHPTSEAHQVACCSPSSPARSPSPHVQFDEAIPVLLWFRFLSDVSLPPFVAGAWAHQGLLLQRGPTPDPVSQELPSSFPVHRSYRQTLGTQ